MKLCCSTVPNDPPRSYLGPISLLLTRTSLYIHSIYLYSNTLLANPFQALVARPRNCVKIRGMLECRGVEKRGYKVEGKSWRARKNSIYAWERFVRCHGPQSREQSCRSASIHLMTFRAERESHPGDFGQTKYLRMWFGAARGAKGLNVRTKELQRFIGALKGSLKALSGVTVTAIPGKTLKILERR